MKISFYKNFPSRLSEIIPGSDATAFAMSFKDWKEGEFQAYEFGKDVGFNIPLINMANKKFASIFRHVHYYDASDANVAMWEKIWLRSEYNWHKNDRSRRTGNLAIVYGQYRSNICIFDIVSNAHNAFGNMNGPVTPYCRKWGQKCQEWVDSTLFNKISESYICMA